jgi:hypothetical protein
MLETTIPPLSSFSLGRWGMDTLFRARGVWRPWSGYVGEDRGWIENLRCYNQHFRNLWLVVPVSFHACDHVLHAKPSGRNLWCNLRRYVVISRKIVLCRYGETSCYMITDFFW